MIRASRPASDGLRSVLSTWVASLAAWILVVPVGVLVPAASAQSEPIEDDSDQLSSAAIGYERPPALELAEMQIIAALLGLQEDQRPLVDDLYKSYQDKLVANRKKFSKWYRATFMPDGRWTNDSEVWEKARKTFDRYTEHCAKLRKNMLDDLRLMLTPEQADRWPKVESRLKRRDLVQSQRLEVGIAALDIEALVISSLGMGAPMPEETRASLEGYQESIDRAAAASAQWTEEGSRYPLPSPEEMREDAASNHRRWQGAWYARQVERWKPMRDANLAAFRRVLPTLPESARDRFRLEFYSRATGVRGWSWGRGQDLDFDRIEALRGLTDDQKRRIAEVRAAYEKAAADRLERRVLDEIKSQDKTRSSSVPGGTRSTGWHRCRSVPRSRKPRAPRSVTS